MILEDTGRAHMVLWLNSNAMEAVTMPQPGLTLRSIGGVMDLYFFLGPSPAEALQQYVTAVGLPAMPAYWALGFQLCRYGYNNLTNLQAAVSRTRRRGIPQDVQYADIDHMDRRLDFTVDPVNFQGLQEYVESVKKEGLRFIVILDPAINAELGAAEYLVHQRARDQDVYIKWPKELVPADNFGAGDVMLGYVWPDNRTAFPDFFRASARAWWKDEITRLFVDTGLHFDGLWIDMNEPANFGTNEEQPWNWPEGREPWSLLCPNTTWEDPPYVPAAVTVWGEDKRLSDKTLCMEALQGEDQEYRHYDVHNLYGWSQAQPTLEALHGATKQRGVVVTRSTFPSSGRWAGHWLGDNSARWADMRKSIIGMMEFNLFGIPYVGADICGFFGDTTEEMCARWMELGAFYPYSRNHNTLGAIDHDPGLWPSVAASSRAALRIRYTLLPHLYTLHHLASTRGHAVVRPLFFEFPDTKATWDLDDQFLWGPWLMVAPVLNQGVVSRSVYFPPGAWFDYHTGRAVEDTDARHDVEAPLGHVPVYVRGGGILVTQRPRANTMHSRTEPLGLVVAPDDQGAAEGFFYWDDGEEIDPVLSGQYFTADVAFDEGAIHWKVSHASLAVTAALLLSDVRVFGVASRPTHLLLDGKRWTTGDWHYDSSVKTLSMYDLELPVTSNFTLSWSSEVTTAFLLPCPLSYQGRTDDSPVTQSECEAQNCVWDVSKEVQCAIPPPEQYGLEFVDGVVSHTAKGFRTRLKPRGAPLYPGGPAEVIFEAYQYTSHMLRVKFYVEDGSRYEVPVPLNLPDEELSDPLYKIVLPEDQGAGQPFFFYVAREDNGTILFDTRIGGLTFTDQFLSISTILPSKNVYGLGENAHDSFRHAMDGKVWPIFGRDQGPVPQAGKQVNLYGAHPFYECVENDGRAHGVLLLNSNAMDYQLLDYPALTFRTIGGVLDLFLMAGPQPESVVAQYTSLIYRPIMPPYWALGFQLCRYGFETLQDLQAAVNRTKDAGLPLDVVYGDIDYMDRRMDFTVDPVRYSGFEEYVTQTKAEGMRFIVILDPAINAELPASEYPTHSRALSVGAYITWAADTDATLVEQNNGGGNLGRVMLGYVWPENKTAFPNFFSQAAQDWWVEEIRIFYDEKNVKFDGLWIDMNEPANFGTNEQQPWNWPEGTAPWSLSCPNSAWDNPPYVTKAAAEGPTHNMADKTLCLAAEETPHRHYDVHNLYGWAQTEPTLRALQRVTGRRGIVVTRSTFPGSGRWAGHWLGDNRSNWTDLAHSIIGMMEFNLFGIPYVGADICGFFGDTTEEMCERWMEVGAFYPYSRNHNTKGTIDQDPGIWGTDVINSSRKALEIRYRLLPYLYTLFYEAHFRGATVVRPLVHEFPTDRRTLAVDDQFLWGSAFMVSPVLTEATTERWVYFPQDAWYDYYSGAPVDFPGERVIVPAPRDTIPLHIRGGSILPTQRPAQNTAISRQMPVGLIVAIGWDRRASGQLFWDDGEMINSVAEKKYSLVEFSFVQHTLTGVVRANTNEDLKGLTLADLEFLGVEKPPSEVTLQNAKIPAANLTYEAASLRLRVRVQHQLNIDFELTLRDVWFYEV
ncbi:maltase-glucoamylase-like isoform X2 [Eriocheir sinensis]|nr:maltase-glucoamylase-like isoform X2 [Eriocheir sinensis]